MNEGKSVLSYLICRVYICLGWGPSFILGPSPVLTPLTGYAVLLRRCSENSRILPLDGAREYCLPGLRE